MNEKLRCLTISAVFLYLTSVNVNSFTATRYTELNKCAVVKHGRNLSQLRLGYDEDSSRERSHMNDYISNFLKKVDTSTNDKATDESNPRRQSTHLIAIPVDTCHELLLELESIQRAILYHCPLLVHACISPAITKLPLLQITSPPGVTDSDASNSIQRILEEVVKNKIFVERNNTDLPTPNEDILNLNSDGIQPITVTFKGLEIDGGLSTSSQNEILSTVGTMESSGSIMLQTLVLELQNQIDQQLGWETSLPPDPINNDNDKQTNSFRPRIPFMRLPTDWESNHLMKQLQERQNGDKINNNLENRVNIEDIYMLSSDEGGNGISPIFWGKWMDDTFGTNIRLREIAVYRRTPRDSDSPKSDGVTEKSFYLPTLPSVPLPLGSVAMLNGESRFEKYQNDRMKEAENVLKSEKQLQENVQREPQIDNDIVYQKARSRLESIYESSQDETGQALLETSIDTKVTRDNIDDNTQLQDEQSSIQVNSNTDILDDWMKGRIQKVVNSRARAQSEKELSVKKDKPSIEDNAVFSKFKDGTLVPDTLKVKTSKELPPFPSEEYCVGFWRFLSSPTGFDVEENDASTSDNLILRVDGTIAGGPILDQET
jgi:hypothetical protein